MMRLVIMIMSVRLISRLGLFLVIDSLIWVWCCGYVCVLLVGMIYEEIVTSSIFESISLKFKKLAVSLGIVVGNIVSRMAGCSGNDSYHCGHDTKDSVE